MLRDRVPAVVLIAVAAGMGCGPSDAIPRLLTRNFDVRMGEDVVGSKSLEIDCRINGSCQQRRVLRYTVDGRDVEEQHSINYGPMWSVEAESLKRTVGGAVEADWSYTTKGVVLTTATGEEYAIPEGHLGCAGLCALGLGAKEVGEFSCLEFDPGFGIRSARGFVEASDKMDIRFSRIPTWMAYFDTPRGQLTRRVDSECREVGESVGELSVTLRRE